MRIRIKRYHKRRGVVNSHIRNVKPSPEFLEYIPMALKREGRVPIKNIGILKLKKIPARKARKGINPFTKKPMTLKAKKAGKKIKFFPSKKLKEAVL